MNLTRLALKTHKDPVLATLTDALQCLDPDAKQRSVGYHYEVWESIIAPVGGNGLMYRARDGALFVRYPGERLGSYPDTGYASS